MGSGQPRGQDQKGAGDSTGDVLTIFTASIIWRKQETTWYIFKWPAYKMKLSTGEQNLRSQTWYFTLANSVQAMHWCDYAMLPSSRRHHLLSEPPRHTMALRGRMNILGTLSSSPSGDPTATSWSMWLGRRAGSSLWDSIFSCQLVHQDDGEDREQLAHKD